MNIVIINNLARFPGTPRWDFDLVRYEDFVCHREHRVHYICNARGVSAITAAPGSYTLHRLEPLGDAAALGALLSQIVAADGPVDRLVVFSESLQDVAAQLRQDFGIPGKRPPQNRLGRDKLLMKQKVAARGLRTPRWMPVSAAQAGEARAFARQAGYPLILKPVDGQSSQGVRRIDDAAQLQAALAALPAQRTFDLEEFIEGTLLHVDGLVDPQGKVRLVVPSTYVNDCLAFTFGAPLGAVMVEPGSAWHARVCRFATACVEAIGLEACPFHLELFHTRGDDLVFLEVGARVGGADVPSVIHKATGVNLFAEWLNMTLGRPLQAGAPVTEVGAWLMFPRPLELPARVEAVTGFEGRLPSLYRQLLPPQGQVMEREEGYCSLQSGRFLFSSPSAEQVQRDVQTVMREFSITTARPE